MLVTIRVLEGRSSPNREDILPINLQHNLDYLVQRCRRRIETYSAWDTEARKRLPESARGLSALLDLPGS
jgi:hypothetical protein